MKIKWILAALIAMMPALASADVDSSQCNEDVLFRFFPKKFVLQVLEKHDVSGKDAESIAATLSDADQQVVQLIEEKADEMTPNPLQDEASHEERAKLFKDALTEVFNEVVNKYGITNTQDIMAMLDEIQQLRIERFEECRKAGHVPDLPQR